MVFNDFQTGKDDISRRLDKVIRIFVSQLTLPEIYKGIRKGLIKVNHRKTKSDYRIQENDIISIANFLVNKSNYEIDSRIEIIKSPTLKINNQNLIMPNIVFENSDLLIINKPYNINVHGDNNSLDKIVEYYLMKNNTVDFTSLSFRPGPLHRLDKKTTGLLAFSKSLEGAHWFTENLQNHNITKKYWGLAEGNLIKSEKWIDYITKNSQVGKSFHTVVATSNKTNGSELAETIVTPLFHGVYKGIDVSLVEYNIKTGRKHQIRAQSSLHGHALLGDTIYGGTKLHNENCDFYLTAKELILPKENPLNLPEKLTIPLPSDFIMVLKRCGIEKADV